MHIWRLVAAQTVEENILAKSDQKRHLDFLAIQSGGFNTEFLTKFSPRDLLGFQGARCTSAGQGPGSRVGPTGRIITSGSFNTELDQVEPQGPTQLWGGAPRLQCLASKASLQGCRQPPPGGLNTRVLAKVSPRDLLRFQGACHALLGLPLHRVPCRSTAGSGTPPKPGRA